MTISAVAALIAGAGQLVLAIFGDGVRWIPLVGGGCFVWLGGTLAATIAWRRRQASNAAPRVP